MVRLIRKTYVFKCYRCTFFLYQIFPAHILICLIHHNKYTLCTGNSGLQLPINLRDFINWPAELLGIDNKRRNNTYGNQPVYRKISSKCRDDNESNIR